MFFYLWKVLFSGFLQFQSIFVDDYMGLQGDTRVAGDYKGIQGLKGMTRVYRGYHEIKREYKSLQGITTVYKG